MNKSEAEILRQNARRDYEYELTKIDETEKLNPSDVPMVIQLTPSFTPQQEAHEMGVLLHQEIDNKVAELSELGKTLPSLFRIKVLNAVSPTWRYVSDFVVSRDASVQELQTAYDEAECSYFHSCEGGKRGTLGGRNKDHY